MKTKTTTSTRKKGFGILDRDKDRKAAVKAIAALRSFVRKASADLSVADYYANRLGHDLSNLEVTLNEMLPPVASSAPTLRDLFWEEPESAPYDMQAENRH